MHCLQADNEAMRETLEFVERWAVHHASKPHMTAELALGSIQHHPEIRAITERYADGKRPDTFDPYARIAELEGKVGRFQGVPLPLIEAINAATGSNDWQGDHSPAELLEPACRAITALRAERPMPTVEDASQEWGKVDPITAWHLIERHADNWADIGKMMTEYVQAQIARA
ncbi:hypothetical protein GY14_10450 [Delftia tsuruhatensis]|nr:hypothetical protein GY14_10450 [Delftia tsuruhatensis]